MGTVFLRGNSWVGEYRVNNKPKRITFGKNGPVTKTMAKKRLQEIERQIKLGQWDMLESQIPTLSEFAERYIEHQRDVIQKRSWEKDEAHLKRWETFLGNRKLSEVTAKDIDDYKQARLNAPREIIIKHKDGTQTTKVKYIKPATVNRELEVLRHLFYLAKRWKKFFGENPVSESGLLKVNNLQERILSPEEEGSLIKNSSPTLSLSLSQH